MAFCVISNNFIFLSNPFLFLSFKYARIVREALCELELPYILQNVGEGSLRSKLLDASGCKEVSFWEQLSLRWCSAAIEFDWNLYHMIMIWCVTDLLSAQSGFTMFPMVLSFYCGSYVMNEIFIALLHFSLNYAVILLTACKCFWF